MAGFRPPADFAEVPTVHLWIGVSGPESLGRDPRFGTGGDYKVPSGSLASALAEVLVSNLAWMEEWHDESFDPELVLSESLARLRSRRVRGLPPEYKEKAG